MKFAIQTTTRFNKDFKRCKKRGYPMQKLMEVVALLEQDQPLPPNCLPHKLTGYANGDIWECHIQPDWLLIWKRIEDELILLMLNTGTHSDLFK